MVLQRSAKKSVISTIIVLALVLSCMPLAYAADDIVVTTGDELDAALKAATGTSATTITLANDIDAVTSATYTGYTTGAAITINGQGFTIDGKSTMDTGLRFGARSQELILNIVNTKFANMQNDDRNGGGAIAIWRGVANISDSTFTGNVSTTGSRGGGGVMVQSGSANIDNSEFTGNRANGNGGAIYAGSGSITNVTVTGNHSITGVGGVNGAFTVIKSTIENNTTDSATADPNVSANVVFPENAVGLVIDDSVSNYGVAGVSLAANFSLGKVNLIEATLKYNKAQVEVAGAVAVAGATVERFDVDADKGLINIVIGVAGTDVIANAGSAPIANILMTSIGQDGGSHIAISSFAAYSAGEAVDDVVLAPDAVYARFEYASNADVNGDGVLDARDLSLALYRFGAISTDANWNEVKSADLNGDGAVDMLDITILVEALYA